MAGRFQETPGAGRNQPQQGPRPGRSIGHEFDLRAASAPLAVALEMSAPERVGRLQMTYGELARQSGVLARNLVSAGVRPRDRVAFLTRRNFDVAIAMLGILKAGASYVPLGPGEAECEMEFLLRDSRARCLVHSRGMQPAAGGKDVARIEIGVEGLREAPLPSDAVADEAYLTYSRCPEGGHLCAATGHRAVVSLARRRAGAADGAVRVLQMAPVAEDAASLEIWGALLNGGTCVIPADAGVPDAARLRDMVEQSRIDSFWLTSAHFGLGAEAERAPTRTGATRARMN